MRASRALVRQISQTAKKGFTSPTNTQAFKRGPLLRTALFTAAFGTTSLYLGKRYSARCKDELDDEDDEDFVIKYKSSKIRENFSARASLEYNGEYFMTGRDFLEAWITDEYYEKDKIELYSDEYETLITSVKTSENPSFNSLFTATALISYPDYIFLRSILHRPDDLSVKSFKMLDLDLNGFISLDEYYALCKMFTKNDEGDPKKHLKTTLRVLLFDHTDTGKITLRNFEQLLKDVQQNCLKAEFNKFRQRGNAKDMISVSGFLRAVLRRTKASAFKKAKLLHKAEVYTDIDAISFEQFKSMITLMNNFSDFEVAVRMYQIAKKPLAKLDFKRAVYICSGEMFDDTLLDMIFYVFDEVGDGYLEYTDFVQIMKFPETGFAAKVVQDEQSTLGEYFKKCVRTEMLRSYA